MLGFSGDEEFQHHPLQGALRRENAVYMNSSDEGTLSTSCMHLHKDNVANLMYSLTS